MVLLVRAVILDLRGRLVHRVVQGPREPRELLDRPELLGHQVRQVRRGHLVRQEPQEPLGVPEQLDPPGRWVPPGNPVMQGLVVHLELWDPLEQLGRQDLEEQMEL